MSWESFSIVVLFPQAEFLDQGAVPFEFGLAEVLEEALALAHLGHQAAVAGEILLVLLKVTGDVLDLFGQFGDLAFNGTAVLGTATEFSENS